MLTWEVTANGPKWIGGMISLSYVEIIMRDVGDQRFCGLFFAPVNGLFDLDAGPEMR